MPSLDLCTQSAITGAGLPLAEYKSDVCNICIQFEFEISGGFTRRFSSQEWLRLWNVKSFQRWTTILNEKDDRKHI